MPENHKFFLKILSRLFDRINEFSLRYGLVA